jgi:hypothetical protein
VEELEKNVDEEAAREAQDLEQRKARNKQAQKDDVRNKFRDARLEDDDADLGTRKELCLLTDQERASLRLMSGVARETVAQQEKDKGNEAFHAKDYKEAELFYSRSLVYNDQVAAVFGNRCLTRYRRINMCVVD